MFINKPRMLRYSFSTKRARTFFAMMNYNNLHRRTREWISIGIVAHIDLDLNRFTMHHILSRADQRWTGETGRIRKDLLERLIPAVTRKNDPTQTLICICGPTAFTNSAAE
jgi:hypothetical protein